MAIRDSWLGSTGRKVQRYEFCRRPPSLSRQRQTKTAMQNKPAMSRKEIHAFQKINTCYSWSVPTLKQYSSKVLHTSTKKTVVWPFVGVLWSCQYLPVWLRAGVSPLQVPVCTDLSLVSTVLNILIACQVKKKCVACRQHTKTVHCYRAPEIISWKCVFSSSKISTFFLSSHPALGSYRISDNRKLSFSAWIHPKERR